jgi:DNA-directed RNA polymerase subunit omega
MENHEDLTNESLKKKFKSQFELVGYAIKLAVNMIKTGRAPRIKSDSQNVAINVLEEINAGLDKFEDIPKDSKSDHDVSYARPAEKRDTGKNESNTKTAERKRTRKILMD